MPPAYGGSPRPRSARRRHARVLVFDAPPPDRHRAWRGLLSDDLIDALQAWNDRGEEVMGTHGHEHTNDERAEFWARGQELGVRAQQQLGPDYEVIWRTPEAPPLCE